MCTGVTREFFGVKLAGYLKMFGSFGFNTVILMMVIANPTIFFTVK